MDVMTARMFFSIADLHIMVHFMRYWNGMKWKSAQLDEMYMNLDSWYQIVTKRHTHCQTIEQVN